MLAALRTMRAWLGIVAAQAIYTQDTRPADCKSRDAFARWHRAARRAGVEGVTVRGKVLSATAVAWATPLPRAAKLALVPAAPESLSDKFDAALGIRTRKAGP